jgi:DNA-nicking Smr family endonuclease
MKRGEQDAKVRELVARGFSKAKCNQALKDAGNNATLALRLLEQQKKKKEAQPPPPPLLSHHSRSGHSNAQQASSSAAASIPSLYRVAKASGVAPELTAAQKQLQRERRRRHPCVVQYGSCQYGDACLLKDLPGDVCVQHFQGCCIYGASCRHRHVVDGVDVRNAWNDAPAEEAALVPSREGSGEVREGTEGGRAGLCSHRDPAARMEKGAHGAAFARGSGVVGVGAEAIDSDDSDDEDVDGVGTFTVTASSVPHPTPFLDLARAGAAGSGAAGRHFPSNTTVTQAPTTRPTTTTTTAVGRHPCVAQYGSCKFGDACLHADRDADVCVHFLNGRCRFSAEECRYRHETAEAYQQKLRERVGLNTESVRSSDAVPTAQQQHQQQPVPSHATRAPRSKQRLQGAGVGGGGGNGGSPRPHQHNSSRSDSRGNQQGRVSPSPALATSPLPSMEDINALTASFSKGGSTWDVAEAATESDAEQATTTTSIGDTELRVFLGLVEVYPMVEPAVVLQTLRLCGGDPLKASDMISQFGTALSMTEVESLAAALALAAADEAEEREAATTAAEHAAAMERHNVLLTLITLFPSAEVTAVEAVLRQQRGDFAAAYNVLLCAQEKMARAALWNGDSAALSPADQLRVEKLYAMFPGLHPDIVRSAFCASKRDWSGTTTALNELTKELLSLEAVELPAKPLVWRPRPHPTPAPSTSCPSPPTAATMETSEEAYEAYRAAEKEVLGYGDWRQVRQQAYLINAQRVRVLGQASAAFHQGDGRMAKLLSREGHRMAVEYNRLNRLAMLALEQERLRSDAASTLDLHGFHTAEVHDVVTRRVEVCQQKRIGHLRIVMGEGHHSRRGHGSLYTALMEELRNDAFLRSATRVKSVKAGYVDVVVTLPARDA